MIYYLMPYLRYEMLFSLFSVISLYSRDSVDFITMSLIKEKKPKSQRSLIYERAINLYNHVTFFVYF